MPRRQTEDPENPELTEAFFARAKRGISHLPAPMRQAIEHTIAARRRGPQKAPTKQLVTLRLSRPVLEAYRSTGQGWQARIDEDLQRSAKRIRQGKVSA